MAHLDEISRELLEKVALEIAHFIDRGSTGEMRSLEVETTDALVIAEVITVWKLQPRAFDSLATSSLTGDISDWVETVPFALHHQIRFAGKPEGFARSHTDVAAEEDLVYEISASEFAASLNQALADVERNEGLDPFVAADPVVRVLEIPPFQITALWMFLERSKESRLEIITAPQRYQLPQGRIIDSTQFFAALDLGPITGVA